MLSTSTRVCLSCGSRKTKPPFDRVMDRIVNGWFMQHRRTDKEVPNQTAPAVWLEWVQIYGESPQGKHPGSMFDARNDTVTLQEGVSPEDPRSMRPPIPPSPQQLREFLAGRQAGGRAPGGPGPNQPGRME